jgi:uncharacterized membrane protein
MNQQEVNEREWSTTKNWRFGIYYAPLDSRIWVPKPRRWMGWTLNFAHRVAYLFLAALLLPAIFVLVICVVASSSR